MIEGILITALWLTIGYAYSYLSYNSEEVQSFIKEKYPDDPQWRIDITLNLCMFFTTLVWPVFMVLSGAFYLLNWVTQEKGEE